MAMETIGSGDLVIKTAGATRTWDTIKGSKTQSRMNRRTLLSTVLHGVRTISMTSRRGYPRLPAPDIVPG
jgi:hypothetical protein